VRRVPPAGGAKLSGVPGIGSRPLGNVDQRDVATVARRHHGCRSESVSSVKCIWTRKLRKQASMAAESCAGAREPWQLIGDRLGHQPGLAQVDVFVE